MYFICQVTDIAACVTIYMSVLYLKHIIICMDNILKHLEMCEVQGLLLYLSGHISISANLFYGVLPMCWGYGDPMPPPNSTTEGTGTQTTSAMTSGAEGEDKHSPFILRVL